MAIGNASDGRIDFTIRVDNSKLRQDLERAKADMRSFSSNVQQEAVQMDNSFKRIGMAIGAALTVEGVRRFATAMVDVRGEIQSLELSFTALFKSQEKANEFISFMTDYASKSSYSVSQLGQAVQTMAGFGVETERIIPILESIGNIAMGDAQKLGGLTLAFSQMTATGKLMGQDLLQMINAGFNPLTEIARKTGKSVGELKENMDKIPITAQEVENAFISVTAEGGKFHGMLDATSKGIAGNQAKLKAAIHTTLNELGKDYEETIAKGYEMATSVVKNFDKIASAITTLIALYGTYRAALITVTTVNKATASFANSSAILAEGKALDALVTAEQRSILTKQGMKRGTMEYYTALKVQTLEKKKALATTLEEIKVELASAQASHKAALKKALTAKAEVRAKQEALAVARASGVQANIDTAQTELNNATHARSVAVAERKNTANALAVVSGRAKTAQTALDTVATNVHTASETKATTVTRLLTAAQVKLKAVMATNPYTLIAIAIAAVVYAIYRVVKATRDAEKAQREFNRSVSEGMANVDAERVKIDTLFATLKHAKKGTEEYKTAKDTIISQYGQYLKGLGDEIETLKDVKGAYDAITKSAIESAKARAIQQSTQTAQDSYIEATAKVGEEVERIMEKVRKTGALTTDETVHLERNLRAYINGQEQSLKLTERQRNVLKNTKELHLDSSNNVLGAIAVAKAEQVDATVQLKKSIEQANKVFAGAYDHSVGGASTDVTGGSGVNAVGGKVGKKDYSKEARDRAKLIEDAERDVARKLIDMRFELQQADLDIMNEGSERTRLQIKLNHEKELEQIKRQREDLLKEKQETAQRIFEADSRNKGKSIDVSGVSLSSDEEAYFEQRVKMAEKATEMAMRKQEEVERRAMNEYLKEYGEYLEKRNAMVELMNEEIAQAQTEGDRLSITARWTKELSELDQRAQGTASALGRLFGDMSEQTAGDIRAIIKEAEELQEYLSAGEYVEGAFGITKEQFEVIRKSPEQMKAISDAIKDLKETLTNAEFGVRKLVSAFKEMESAKDNSQAFSEAMGRASQAMQEISGIAGEAVNVFSNLATVLGESEIAEKATEIAGDLVGVMDATMKYAETGAKIGGKTGAIVGAVVGAVSSISKAVSKWVDRGKQEEIERLQKQVDKVKDSYQSLEKAIGKAYGKSAANLIAQNNALLKQQQEIIKQQIKLEGEKKKTDKNRIAQLEKEYKAIGDSIDDNKDKMVDAIYGEDVQGAIDRLSSAITDMWSDGEGKAGDSAKAMVRNTIKKMVETGIKEMSSGEMQEFRAMMQSFWSDGIISEREEAQANSFMQDLERRIEERYGWAKKYYQQDEKESERQAGKQRGLAQASQDSIDELNGTFTSIQLYAASMNEMLSKMIAESTVRVESMQSYTTSVIGYLATISSHTSRLPAMSDTMERIERNTRRL